VCACVVDVVVVCVCVVVLRFGRNSPSSLGVF